MREKMQLNFGWRFSPDYKPEYVKSDFQDTSFKLVDLPHTIKELTGNYCAEKAFQRISCYRKNFILPSTMDNKRIILHFEGVMGCAAVFVNGKPVSAHKGGYTPFSCDITESLHDGDNLLAVVVDSSEREDTPPFGGAMDFLSYGGIYREVWLEAAEQIYITDVFVRPVAVGLMWTVRVDGTLNREAQCDYKLYLFNGEERIATKYCKASGRAFSFEWELQVEVENWSPDNPKLYTFVIKLPNNDVLELPIGFRTAEFTPDGFFLNGKPLKLRGLSRHQSYPYVGYAMPSTAQRFDAEQLKRLGCNFVRTSHYTQSRHFIERCDQLGIMVFEEMPGWNHIGDADWKQCALDNLREMIIRDRNHPSVILWGVRINESSDNDRFYQETNALAHELDPSRQTTGARNFAGSNLLEDVYAFNDFSYEGRPLQNRRDITTGNVPYIVAEHTGYVYPTKSFDCEAIRVEQALRHTRVLSAMYTDKAISGCIGCSFTDYNTHPGFGSGDMMCYHGVCDSQRVPKDAAYVYESQCDDHVVMHVASSLANGDFENGVLAQVYVFTNCDEVRLSINGNVIRSFYPDKHQFPGLAHPPVVVNDFIGDMLEKREGFDASDARAIKSFMLTSGGDSGKLSVMDKVKFNSVMKKYSLTYDDVAALYTKYTGGWEERTYTFEGIKNGKVVAKSVKEAVHEVKLETSVYNSDMVHAETFDVARIELLATDQNGNRLNYCFDGVSVECEGSIEVIGPRLFSLRGGAAAFFVRTKGGRGEAQVKIRTESLGTKIIYLNVERRTQRDLNHSKLVLFDEKAEMLGGHDSEYIPVSLPEEEED